MTDTGSRPRHTWAMALVAAVAAVLVMASAPPAVAHARLVDTDPDQGAVLQSAPDVVTFTFNESVTGVADGVEVFDAEGRAIASSSKTRDKQLLVTLEGDIGEGTVTVAWRVVSADDHPIGGSLTFSIGEPSPNVTPSDVGGSTADVPVALSLSRWPAYAGLLIAVGLVWFSTLLLPAELHKLERARRRLRTTARLAAAVAAVAWLLGLPLTALYLRGTQASTLLGELTWQALPNREIVITGTVAIAVIASVSMLPAAPGKARRRWLAAAVGLLALAPLPLSGHTRTAEPADLSVLFDFLHLVAGATWLGGIVGLALTIPALAGRNDAAAELVSRFSTAAATVLAVLVLSGSFLAWRIVGSWTALATSGYGRLLLVKIAIAALAVAIAGFNRFRLVPRIRGAAGFHDRTATGRILVRTATTEAAALVAVLLITGFLVHTSPPTDPAAAGVRSATERTTLGGLTAIVTLAPATTGKNTVTVQLLNSAGTPAELLTPPRVRVSSDELDLGEITVAPVALGSYRGTVTLPRDGTWRVQISLRLSRFDNPVSSVEFQVDAQPGRG